MNHGLNRVALSALLAVMLLAMTSDQAARAPVPKPGVPGIPAAASLISHWPEQPRALAGLMLEKYGAPDEVVASQISWNERPPWSKIVVFRDPDTSGRSDHLLEAVSYVPVHLDRWRELAAFGRGAIYDPVRHELAARTDGEATNFLALNLADEVIRGRRPAAEARDFYDAASNLSQSGKSSPYMTGLLFKPGRAFAR